MSRKKNDTPTTTAKPAAKARSSTPVPTSINTIPDLFSGAPAPVAASKAKSKKKEREEVDFGPDLDQLGAIEVLTKALEGAGAQLKEQIKDRGYEEYTKKAAETKHHPDSFIAAGECATASIEMRVRASSLSIDEAIVPHLQKAGVAIERTIKTPEQWFFDNSLLQQVEIRQAVSEALSRHPKLSGILPTLLKHQQEVYHWTTNKSTLEDAAAKLTKDEYANLIRSLSSLAVGKWHLDGEGVQKEVTPAAKARAISILQEMGVLPPAAKAKAK